MPRAFVIADNVHAYCSSHQRWQRAKVRIHSRVANRAVNLAMVIKRTLVAHP